MVAYLWKLRQQVAELPHKMEPVCRVLCEDFAEKAHSVQLNIGAVRIDEKDGERHGSESEDSLLWCAYTHQQPSEMPEDLSSLQQTGWPSRAGHTTCFGIARAAAGSGFPFEGSSERWPLAP